MNYSSTIISVTAIVTPALVSLASLLGNSYSNHLKYKQETAIQEKQDLVHVQQIFEQLSLSMTKAVNNPSESNVSAVYRAAGVAKLYLPESAIDLLDNFISQLEASADFAMPRANKAIAALNQELRKQAKSQVHTNRKE